MHRKGIYIPDIPDKCDYSWEEARVEAKEGGSTIRIS